MFSFNYFSLTFLAFFIFSIITETFFSGSFTRYRPKVLSMSMILSRPSFYLLYWVVKILISDFAAIFWFDSNIVSAREAFGSSPFFTMFGLLKFIPVSRSSSTSKDTLRPWRRLLRLCLRYGLFSSLLEEDSPRCGDLRCGDTFYFGSLLDEPIGVRLFADHCGGRKNWKLLESCIIFEKLKLILFK